MKRRHFSPPPLPLLLLLASILSVADANMFKVNWTSGVNFNDWTSDKRFFTGDWLYFVFNKYQYSVLEVNYTSYEKCIETDFLTNVTKGGRDVIQLNDSRPYYFISGFGQCWGGVKLAINVAESPPAKPALPENGSPVVKVSGFFMFLAWAFNAALAF